MNHSQPLAIYVHWPFCKKKCPYCDFNSHVREDVDHMAWQTAMLGELSHMAAWMPHHTPTSIFFGGGTPSLMHPATTEAIISRIHTLWQCDEDIEITLEANPTSVEAARFADFKAAGVNRVSLGVQSLRDESLRFLGREHNATEALAAVELAATLFDRYSFDMIYALPNQSAMMWEAELRAALPYTQDHMSLYQLTIEENTAFYHAYHKQKAFNLPDDTLSSELFLLTQDIMEEAAMPAYEVSNHAASGEESRHNMSYWLGHPYLGIGAGAHGRAIINCTWHATNTHKSPQRWLEVAQKQGHALEASIALCEQERAEEYVMMGLRLAQGINLHQFNCGELINHERLTRFKRDKLLVSEGDQWHATHAGWLVLNEIIRQLLSE